MEIVDVKNLVLDYFAELDISALIVLGVEFYLIVGSINCLCNLLKKALKNIWKSILKNLIVMTFCICKKYSILIKGGNMFNYRLASIEDLEKIWDKDIQENLNDKRYLKWKDEFIEANKAENIITFVVLYNDEPVGQASIVLNKNNISAKCRDFLCDGKEKAYVSTLRIEKRFESQGHISNLMKMIEDFAKSKNIKSLTIGAEAKESRNLAIYLHFGYMKFVSSEVDNGRLILFYEKEISWSDFFKSNKK